MHSSIHVRSDIEPIDSSLVQSFVSEIVTSQYLNVALLTILIYFSICTMDKEVRYFWSNPRSAVSVIFFMNRYVGILSAICGILNTTLKETLMMCQFADWAQQIADLITIVLVDYVLLIRVLALYSLNKKLGILLKALLAFEAAAGLCLLIYGNVISEVAVGMLAEDVTICVLSGDPPVTLVIISWTIPMAYGVVLLALVLYKAAEHWKLSRGFKGSHLITVLVQDQILYYGFVVFCCVLRIMEITIYNINTFVAAVLNVAGSPTLLCVLGAQLLINLKEVGEKGVNGGTINQSRIISDIQFA